MTVGHPTCFSVSETMWGEVENKVIVIWSNPGPQIKQINELMHCFNVCVCSTEMRHKQGHMSNHDSDS